MAFNSDIKAVVCDFWIRDPSLEEPLFMQGIKQITKFLKIYIPSNIGNRHLLPICVHLTNQTCKGRHEK